jgi:PKD repeat protein
MKFFFTATLCVFSAFGFSQQINVWRFGQGAGLDFNSGSPVALPAGPMSTFESSSSICDNQGQLLFYTDGVTVWNRNNVAMPNGTGLLGGNSATQTLIVPKPNDCSKYYIFHSGDHFTGNIGGYYTVVDMCLNGGLGDVVTGSKNVQMLTNCSEKWTAVKHSNGTDVWILCHEIGNANFRKFLLTPAGLGASTVQSIGSVHSNVCQIGSLRASHNGQKILSANTFNCTQLDMFDFDPGTGQLSAYVNMTSMIGYDWYYGIEFSPNDQLLYLTDCYNTSSVYQVNLSNYSRVTLATNGSQYAYGGLQLAPDGKIYIARDGQNYLSVINNPNVLGTGCSFVNTGVTLAAGTLCNLGLIQHVPWATTAPVPQFVSLGNDTTLGCANPLVLAPASACNATYLWNTSSANDSLTITSAGTYWVQITNVCGTGRDTIVVSGASGNTSAQFIFPMSAQCGLPVNFMNTSSGATSYYWNFGDNTSSTQTSPSHTYASSGSYQVMLIASGACGSDTTYSIVTVDPSSAAAQFTSSGTSCGSPVTFTNSSSGATTYFWDFGDNTTSSAANPTHIYTAAGTYQVMLIASNICDSDTSFALITIVPGSVSAAFASVSSACVGNPVFFSNSSSGATTYQWDFGDLGTSSAASPAHVYSTAGTYTVTLIATGACVNDTVTNTITINAIPVAAITGLDTICAGQTITLTASGGGTYQWSGGSSATTAAITVTPTVNTPYYITVSAGTCVGVPDTHIVTVLAPPVAVITGPATICAGQTVTLTASGGGTYQWSGGSNATTTSITIAPTSATTYYVMPSYGLCVGTPDTHVVNVVPVPVVNASGSTTICAGQSVTLTASGGGSYQWSGGSNDTTATITVAPSVTTNYYVTASNGFCTSAFDTATVVVLPSPTATIAAPAMICAGTTLTLTAVGTATTWIWSGGAIGTGPTITDNPTGTSNYYLVGFNAQGCSDTDMVTVGIFDTPTFAIYGDDTLCVGESSQLSCTGTGSFTWSPATGLNSTTTQNVIASPTTTITYSVQVTDVNGCTGSDVMTVVVDPCTGIAEEHTAAEINVFPNPSSGVYSIDLNTTQPVLVEVYNALGQIIYTESVSTVNGPLYTLDLSGAAEGNYLLKVTGEKGIQIQKIQLVR